jgi:2,4-dichlorophenol 6-monooxygenase
LLDSYSEERAPVGRQVVLRANQSRLDNAPLNACFRVAGADNPVAAGIARFHDSGPEGVAARRALLDAIDLKHYEFNAQGTEMNQRYVSGAVLADPFAEPETWVRDPQLHVQPTTRPGAKIPHVWLVGRDGLRVSTLDVTGKGLFSLVTGLAGQAWVEAADALGLPFLRTVVVGEANAQDLYCEWQRVREIDEAGALLVRPDGYVAWRELDAVLDPATAREKLHSAMCAMLDQASLAGISRFAATSGGAATDRSPGLFA